MNCKAKVFALVLLVYTTKSTNVTKEGVNEKKKNPPFLFDGFTSI